jgi:hypothetical protein
MSDHVRAARILIDYRTLGDMIGLPGADIGGIETTDYDQCVAISVRHPSLPPVERLERLPTKTIRFRSVPIAEGIDDY